MLDIVKIIALWPGLYDTSDEGNGSNIHNITKVVVEELNKVNIKFQEIDDLVLLANLEGVQLDLRAAEFGLTREGRTDDDFKVILSAKISNLINGNSIQNVITYFSLFIVPDTNIILTERFIGALGEILNAERDLDATWLLSGIGFRRRSSFDVDVGAVAPELENALTTALQLLKGGGIEATVNLPGIPP